MTRDSWKLWLVISLAAFNGCQPGPVTRARDDRSLKASPAGPNPGSGQTFSPDVLTAKDRCPAQLQNIEGAILLYSTLHKKLPEKLDELAAYSDSPLNLVCPESKLRYVYVPVGLRKPGGTKRIIVHDPARHADGTRWCIVMNDGRPGGSQSTEVVQLPEPLFLAYQ